MRIFSELTLCFNTKADVQGSGVCVCVCVCVWVCVINQLGTAVRALQPETCSRPDVQN